MCVRKAPRPGKDLRKEQEEESGRPSTEASSAHPASRVGGCQRRAQREFWEEHCLGGAMKSALTHSWQILCLIKEMCLELIKTTINNKTNTQIRWSEQSQEEVCRQPVSHLVIKKVDIKTTMRFHHPPSRMAEITENDHTKCWRRWGNTLVWVVS